MSVFTNLQNQDHLQQITEIYRTSIANHASPQERIQALQNLNNVKCNNSDQFIAVNLGVLESGQSDEIKMCAATQFKNFILMDWNSEDSLVSENVKRGIVPSMLSLFNAQASSKIGKILLVAIECMSKDKLQYEWKDMLVFIDNYFKESSLFFSQGNEDYDRLQRCDKLFKLLARVTVNWRNKPRNDEFWTEILLVLDLFCKEVTSSFPLMLDYVLNKFLTNLKENKMQNLIGYTNCLRHLIQFYQNLNCQDIPDHFFDFFKDQMQKFKHLFNTINALQNIDYQLKRKIDKMKLDLIQAIRMLYKYHDEVGEQLQDFTNTVTDVLTNANQSEFKYELVSECFSFLYQALNFQGNLNYFQGNLSNFLNHIISANLITPDQDDFMDDPRKFVENQTSEEYTSSLKSAMDFSRELTLKFGDQYLNLVSEVLKNQFGQNQPNGHEVATLDCIINLIISCQAIYSSSVFGARDVTMNEMQLNQIKDVFILELDRIDLKNNNEKNIKGIFIMRQFTVFRMQLDQNDVIKIVGHLMNFTTSNSKGLYLYSFQVLQSLANLKKSQRVKNEHDLSTLRFNLCDTILSKQTFIKECGVQKYIGMMLKHSIHHIFNSNTNNFQNYQKNLCFQLRQNVLYIMGEKQDQEFNKNLFEAIGYQIRMFSQQTANGLNLDSSELNETLNLVETIINTNVEEFQGWALQLKSLKMTLLMSGKTLTPADLDLFRNLLNPSYQTRDKRHYVNGQVSLLSSFVVAKPGISTCQEYPQFLEGAFGLFQQLTNNKQQTSAFSLVNAVVVNCEVAHWLALIPSFFNQVFACLTVFKEATAQGFQVQGRSQFNNGFLTVFTNMIAKAGMATVYTAVSSIGNGFFERMLQSEIQNRNTFTINMNLKTQVVNCLVSMLDGVNLSDISSLEIYKALFENILYLTVSNIKDLKTNKNEDNKEFEEDKFQGDSVQTVLRSCTISENFVVSPGFGSLAESRTRFVNKLQNSRVSIVHKAWENQLNDEKVKRKYQIIIGK